jgi:hypothetical protein
MGTIWLAGTLTGCGSAGWGGAKQPISNNGATTLKDEAFIFTLFSYKYKTTVYTIIYL